MSFIKYKQRLKNETYGKTLFPETQSGFQEARNKIDNLYTYNKFDELKLIAKKIGKLV